MNLILGLCERFHCLPSQLLDEDATLLQMLAISARGNPPQQAPDDGFDHSMF